MVLADEVFLIKGCLPGFQTATYFYCVLSDAHGNRARFLVSLLIRTLILLGQGPTLMASLNLNNFHKEPISK